MYAMVVQAVQNIGDVQSTDVKSFFEKFSAHVVTVGNSVYVNGSVFSLGDYAVAFPDKDGYYVHVVSARFFKSQVTEFQPLSIKRWTTRHRKAVKKFLLSGGPRVLLKNYYPDLSDDEMDIWVSESRAQHNLKVQSLVGEIDHILRLPTTSEDARSALRTLRRKVVSLAKT